MKIGGGNKVISSALESPFSDAKASGNGLLTCKEEKHEEESIMARQLPWDRYEVALLLDAYLRIQEEPQKEKDILADLSKNLRKRAIHLGYTIDAVFRNENGMSLQYQRMKFLMTNSAYGFDGPVSRCFHEVVEIYKKDRNWYQMILNKARKEAGLEVQEKKKKAPIIVVDGVRVDAGASDKNAEPVKKPPPVPVIKHELVIHEVPTSTNSSEISIVDRLHLAPALQRKLEEEGIHTIKALQHFLADYKENYMIDFKDWQDANDKLHAYLKEASSCSSASASTEESPFEKKRAETDDASAEKSDQRIAKLREETFRQIPLYAQRWNIYRLDLPWELYGRLYAANIHTVKELYGYLITHSADGTFTLEECTAVRKELLAFTQKFHKKTLPKTKLALAEKSLPTDAVKTPYLITTAFADIPADTRKASISELHVEETAAEKMRLHHVNTVEDLYKFLASSKYNTVLLYHEWKSVKNKLNSFLDTHKEKKVPPSAKKRLDAILQVSSIDEGRSVKLASQVTAETAAGYGDHDEELSQMTCDLSEKREYAAFIPISFCYFGKETRVYGWRDMYVKCCKTLYEDYPTIFQRLASASRKQPGPNYVGNSFETRYMHNGVSIGGIWYVETKIKPKQMMGILRAIVKNSDVDYENLTFTFLVPKDAIEPGKAAPAAPAMREPDDARTAEMPKDMPDIKAEKPSASEVDKLAQVLREKFPDGLRQQNLAMKQYKARYEEMFGEALLVQNAMLMEKLRDIGEVRVDGRIYAKASGAEQGILEGIAKELMRLLDESASSLYWSCIYEHYRNEFSGLSIFTEDVMRSELIPLFSSDYVCGEVISKRWETQSRGEEIRRLVTGSPVAISLTSIQEKIWYWPQNMVKKFLDGVPGIIKAKDLYFYGPNVTLSDTEEQRLRDALLEDIAQKQFITNVRLREILEESCPGVAMDMSSLDDALLRKVLAMLYPADFIERAKGLFPAGHMKSGREQIQEYCHAHTKLSTSDIKWFAKQRGILGNICNYVMDEMVRVSPEEWIRRDHVHFQGKEAHIIQKIGQQMGGKTCMPLEEFTLFLSFPDIGIPWNSYVLESFLYKNDAILCPFSLVQANGGVSDSGVYGAVIKKGYAIDSYDDVLIELLSRSPDWQTDEEALDFIVAHKLQVLRKLKQIGTIVKQAKRKRAQLVTANS